MRILILILILFFITANVITEFVNRKALPPLSNPMSSYLAGVQLAWLQDAGFFALAAALPLVAGVFHDTVCSASLYVASFAILIVVATKWIIHESGSTAEQALMERIHVVAAGVAFAGTNLALLIYTWHSGGLAFGAALAAPISATLFARFKPGATAVEEKSYTALLMLSLIALFH